MLYFAVAYLAGITMIDLSILYKRGQDRDWSDYLITTLGVVSTYIVANAAIG